MSHSRAAANACTAAARALASPRASSDTQQRIISVVPLPHRACCMSTTCFPALPPHLSPMPHHQSELLRLLLPLRRSTAGEERRCNCPPPHARSGGQQTNRVRRGERGTRRERGHTQREGPGRVALTGTIVPTRERPQQGHARGILRFSRNT